MRVSHLALVAPFALTACDEQAMQTFFGTAPEPPVEEVIETLDPTPPPPPPPTARTVEQFDTTSQEDRQEALDVAAPSGEQSLGSTNVSLGSPADPGIWLKTPLVEALTEGRVVYPANGNTLNIELRPSGGEPGSGSEMSLAAMRLLDIPLTALADVEVFQ